MVNRLQSSIFILLALFIMGWGLVPIVRVAFGFENSLAGSFIWHVSFLIGGLMCGLTGMLLLVRRQPEIASYDITEFKRSNKDHVKAQHRLAARMHASGLLLLSGIPLANFLVAYWLWVKHRSTSEYLDYVGREVICFQITIYLYFLMCLFLSFIIVGALAIPVIVLLHTIATIIGVITALNDKVFIYPTNINIIDRAPKPDESID